MHRLCVLFVRRQTKNDCRSRLACRPAARTPERHHGTEQVRRQLPGICFQPWVIMSIDVCSRPVKSCTFLPRLVHICSAKHKHLGAYQNGSLDRKVALFCWDLCSFAPQKINIWVGQNWGPYQKWESWWKSSERLNQTMIWWGFSTFPPETQMLMGDPQCHWFCQIKEHPSKHIQFRYGAQCKWVCPRLRGKVTNRLLFELCELWQNE